MKVKEVMSAEVETCRPEVPLAEAVRIMWEKDCGMVPVVEPEGAVVGVITDRDACMATALGGQALHRIKVEDVMTRSVQTCQPTDSLRRVHDTMQAHQVHRLVVTDEEQRLAGIVSVNDLARVALGSKARTGMTSPRDLTRTLASITRPRTEGQDEQAD